MDPSAWLPRFADSTQPGMSLNDNLILVWESAGMGVVQVFSSFNFSVDFKFLISQSNYYGSEGMEGGGEGGGGWRDFF